VSGAERQTAYAEDYLAPSALPPQEEEGGLRLEWEGRKTYKTVVPKPRVLDEVERYTFGKDKQQADSYVIEGDNLQALVSLHSQYRAQIDICYIDPPYNTGRKDLAYSDTRTHDPNADASDWVYVSNVDGGRHTKWMNTLAPRLAMIHRMLAPHGVLFVSIHDIELFRLGMLLDDLFGERNRIGIIAWNNATNNNRTRIASEHEYILAYAKDIDSVPDVWTGPDEVQLLMLEKFEELEQEHSDDTSLSAAWTAWLDAQPLPMDDKEEEAEPNGESELPISKKLRVFKEASHKDGPHYWSSRHIANSKPGGNAEEVVNPKTGIKLKLPKNGSRFSTKEQLRMLEEGELRDESGGKNLPQRIERLRDRQVPNLSSVISVKSEGGTRVLERLFPQWDSKAFLHPKPPELIERLLVFAGDRDSLVLDAFAGTGTTAHAVMRLNKEDGGGRRFIVIEEGSPDNPYCQTILIPRLKRAAEVEDLPVSFTHLRTGSLIDREAILDFEREKLVHVICQTDVTGQGRGIQRVEGAAYVIGHNQREEAVALYWTGRGDYDSRVTLAVLDDVFAEVEKLNLRFPVRVYGVSCKLSETRDFTFCQIPDEIVAALYQLEDRSEDEEAVE
jgi:adenine-specific DNA-methyltransferase